MRRALVALVVVGVLAPAGASARPWLTMHRAKRAAVGYINGWAQHANWADCDRLSPRRVRCLMDGTYINATGGPQLEADGARSAVGQEVQQYVMVQLARGRVRVSDADAPGY